MQAGPRLPSTSSGQPSSVDVPQDEIMRIYELLRPGRARDKGPLLDGRRTLRETYGAERMAAFVEEAAAVYERRGLFRVQVLRAA